MFFEDKIHFFLHIRYLKTHKLPKCAAFLGWNICFEFKMCSWIQRILPRFLDLGKTSLDMYKNSNGKGKKSRAPRLELVELGQSHLQSPEQICCPVSSASKPWWLPSRAAAFSCPAPTPPRPHWLLLCTLGALSVRVLDGFGGHLFLPLNSKHPVASLSTRQGENSNEENQQSSSGGRTDLGETFLYRPCLSF